MPRTTCTRFCCCCGIEATVWSDSDHAWGEYRCAGCRPVRRPSASKTTAATRRARTRYLLEARS